MNHNKSIAFVYGDDRQIYLANLFANINWNVYTYNLSSPLLSNKCIKCSTIESVSSKCDILVFPFKIDIIPLKELSSMLPFIKEKTIFTGNITTNHTKMFINNNITYYDFFKTDYVTRLNAIATAEGCIKEAIDLSPYNLHGSKCLVLGYGNCGQVLANKLSGLNCDVTVGCRNSYQGACALSEGHNYINLSKIHTYISDYLFIFNTIPHLVLDESLLKKIDSQTIIIDIASLPGGIDFEYAKMNNLIAKNIPGIPGKISPMSSAKILFDYIIYVLS